MLLLHLCILAALAIAFLFSSSRLVPVLVFLTAGVLGFFAFKQLSIPFNTPGQILIESYPWSKSFGLNLDFITKGSSLVMSILISGIGAGVFLYAYEYMKGKERLNSFFGTLTLFTLAMTGMVLSDNFYLFFIFWEITSICSFHLVGYNNATEDTRMAARKALLITVFGGLFLLVGFILLSLHQQQTGLTLAESLKFSTLTNSVTSATNYPLILVCFLLAVATKSALFPFHIWLPGAMAGPTPVSSFLHSATMVKAGIFLLCKLHPSLGNTDLWFYLFTFGGSLTMFIGAYLAASQRDIKKILAYSTISVLGILTMLLGIGTEYSIKAAIVFLVAHALYKASLFQIIGNIDYSVGSRDIKTLGNLKSYLPITALTAALATFSMAGSPPLFGFFGKELAYLAKIQLGSSGIFLTIVAVVTNILLVGLALSVCYFPFWKKVDKPVTLKRKPTVIMQLVPLILSCLGLVIGVFPGLFDQYFGSDMATDVLGAGLKMKLKYWHGFNAESLIVLGLSILTLTLGLFVAIKMKQIILIFDKFKVKAKPLGPTRGFDLLIEKTLLTAKWFTRKIQNGSLRNYLHTYIYATILLLLPLFIAFQSAISIKGQFEPFRLLLTFVALTPILLILKTRQYFKRLILLGLSGLIIVCAFAFYGAYDLALTLLMVETLSIFFLLKLGEKPSPIESKFHWFTIIPIIVLAVMMTLALLVQISPSVSVVANYYLKNSLIEAFGKNVVNVILVDFRALDTFGEVLVIAIAGLGVVHSLGGQKNEQ